MKKWIAMLLAALLLAAPCALAEAQLPSATPEIEAMLPIFDSILRTAIEDASSYDPGNAEYVWGMLYRMGVNFGLDYPETSIDEDTYDIIIPGSLMRAFAASAFPSLDALPAPLYGSAFDEAQDAYRLPGSDMGETETQIVNIAEDGERKTVVVMLVGPDGDTSEQMAITVSPAAEGALFPYIVVKAE